MGHQETASVIPSIEDMSFDELREEMGEHVFFLRELELNANERGNDKGYTRAEQIALVAVNERKELCSRAIQAFSKVTWRTLKTLGGTH